MTLALTGATGFVGSTLIECAAEAGTHLKALTRREQAPCENMEWVRGGLDDTAALRRLVRGTEAVLHVAGVVNTPDPAGFEPAPLPGTLNLIAASPPAAVRRLVFASSLPPRPPALSPHRPPTTAGPASAAPSGPTSPRRFGMPRRTAPRTSP